MMNGGAFPSSLVQQMMGGIPNWWNMDNLRSISQEISAFSLPSSSSSSLSSSSSSSSSSVLPQFLKPISNPFPMTPWHDNHELPESWSQLLLGGLVEEEDASSFAPYLARKIDSWDDHQMTYSSANSTFMLDVKQENSGNGYAYYYDHNHQENQPSRSSWSQAALPGSSPRSCVTTSFKSNMLDFSNCKEQRKHQQSDHLSECNSSSGAAIKKAKLQASSAQSPLKVRKEKLGDRITALHQLVSPFGKTDTASVLLESIGYIRFLQSQIEALSSPYLGSGSKNIRHNGKGERCSIFPEDPGQLFNETCLKKIGPPDQDADHDEPKKDLRSRGLCLVPVSFTMHVGSDNGADYWAPNFGAGVR